MSSVQEVIRTMRAVRQFTDQPLPEDAVRAILTAGRRAQSSKNSQPWHFVVVRDRARLKQLSECGTYAGHLAGAAMGVVLVTPDAPKDASPAEQVEHRAWIMFDVGQAVAYMQLAASDLGVGSCIATIYEPEKAKAILGVPQDMRCDVAISFGYPAPGAIRPTLSAGGRRSYEDVVHFEQW
ncbi:MAG: nitroreductase family protein [Ktedonobacterales bacterium]